MKYGKLIQKAVYLTNPSWADKWIDYKKLKKIIKLIVRSNCTGSQIPSLEAISSSDEEDERKTIASPVVSASSTESNDAVDEGETASGESMKQGLNSDILASMSSSEPEKMFFKELGAQLQKVTHFYEQKEAALLRRTNEFLLEIDLFESKREQLESKKTSYSSASSLMLGRLLDECKLLHVDQMMLENFAVLNYGGFAKILKKHDKNTNLATQERYLQRVVNPKSFTFFRRLREAVSRTEQGFSKIKSYLDNIQAVAADVPTNSKVLKSLIEINEEGCSEVAPFRGADATGTIRGKSPIRDLIGVKRKIANEISDKPPSSPRKVHVTSAGNEKLSA